MRALIIVCLGVLLASCAGSDAAGALPVPMPQPTAASRRPGGVSGPGPLLVSWSAGRAAYLLSPRDPSSGQALAGYPPIALGDSYAYGFSAAGDRAAFVSFHGQACDPYQGGTRCRGSAGVLHLLDLPAWRELTATLPAAGTITSVVYSPDARRLALAYVVAESGTALLLDAGSGKTLAHRPLGFAPALLGFANGGDAVVAYGQPAGEPAGEGKPGPPRVVVLDGRTLALRWELVLKNVTSGLWCSEDCQAGHQDQRYVEWGPAVVMSPDGRRLHIIHADKEQLTTVDLQARSARTIDIRAPRSLLDRLLALGAGVAEAKGVSSGAVRSAAISPDGRRLYVTGLSWTPAAGAGPADAPGAQYYGLREVDAETGRLLAQRETQADEVRAVLGGRYLLLTGSGNGRWTEVFLPGTLERLAHMDDDWGVAPTWRQDGSPLILASKPGPESSAIAELDAQSFQVLHSWMAEAWAAWVTGQ